MKKLSKILFCSLLTVIMAFSGAVSAFASSRGSGNFRISEAFSESEGEIADSGRLDSLIEESILYSSSVGSGKAVSVSGSRELTYFKSVKDKNTWNYNKISVSLNGAKISDVAYLINETTYVPLRAAMTLAGASVTFDS